MKQTSYIIHDAGIFSTIGLVTVAWASTTEESIALFSVIRLALIFIVFAALIHHILRHPSKFGTILSGVVSIGLIALYSVFAFSVNAPSASINFHYHLIWVLVSAAIFGLLYLSPRNRPLIADTVAWVYILFCLAILIITIFQGGLLLDGVPRFSFDLTTDEGGKLTYSQGVSKFYGLGAIFVAGLFTNRELTLRCRLFLCFLLVLYLVLSLLGGGRGDFVFALIISIFRLRFFNNIRGYFFLLVAYVLFVVFQDISSFRFDDFAVLFDRYYALGHSYGMRDILLIQSFSLLFDEFSCLIFGCGINYFQFYYGYPVGMYPHNVPIEFLISFGLIISIPLFWLILLGCRRVYIVEGFASSLLYIFAYFFLISLKSGSLLQSYILVGFCCFLIFKGSSAFYYSLNKKRGQFAPH